MTSPQSDLHLAVRRSIAGLNALASYDFVDRDRIFIFAHSIGPLEGVLVAQKFPVRGFIAAETIGRSWVEYSLDNARRQMLIWASHTMMPIALFVYGTLSAPLSNRKTDARRDCEGLARLQRCRQYLWTSATYLQQIAELDLAVEWKKVDVPVLVTYGTSDPTTRRKKATISRA